MLHLGFGCNAVAELKPRGWLDLLGGGANNYPVVNGGSDLELWLFIFPIKWGAIWSYQEFPNHTLDNIQIF